MTMKWLKKWSLTIILKRAKNVIGACHQSSKNLSSHFKWHLTLSDLMISRVQLFYLANSQEFASISKINFAKKNLESKISYYVFPLASFFLVIGITFCFYFSISL